MERGADGERKMKKIDLPTIIVWGSAALGAALISAIGNSHTVPKPYEYPVAATAGALIFVVFLQLPLWVAHFWWPNFVARIFTAGFKAAKILLPAFFLALVVAGLFEPPPRSPAEICNGLVGREFEDCSESFNQDRDYPDPE